MMLEKYLRRLIGNKKILIMGFGREGRSTLKMIEKVGGYESVAIADVNPVNDTDIPVYSGCDYQKSIYDFDIVFKSPGVVLEDLSVKEKIISQTDVIIECYKDKMIGITGTKGKSTTTSLIYHVLDFAGKNPVLMGNIGIPAFDAIESFSDSGVIVYELSCHQLEFAKKSPHTGVLLNIYPEHLDHYGTFDKYKAAKENIYRYMEKSDCLICGFEFAPVDFQGDIITVSMGNEKADIVADAESIHTDELRLTPECNLFGIHNMYNAGMAYAVCSRFGITQDVFCDALATFRPLPHRLELFAEIDGVRYFDDSISTIPETTIKAVMSIKNPGTLILGGMDRGIDLSTLVDFLISNPVPNIILMPDTGLKLFELLKNKCSSKLYTVSDLKEASLKAKEVTPEGSACILSPAAASYGFFKNFEERGDFFKKCING